MLACYEQAEHRGLCLAFASGPSGTGAGAAVTASIPPTPQTQDIIAAPSPAASSRSQSPLPPYLHHSQQPRQQQQEEEEGETEVEQVQHETLQQPAKQQKQHKREFPSVGLNEEGYPMFRGAPNCAYYMGTGRCDFNVRCKFHHPPYALHPDCVAKGEPLFPPSLPPLLQNIQGTLSPAGVWL